MVESSEKWGSLRCSRQRGLALQALNTGATLVLIVDGRDRENRHTGQWREHEGRRRTCSPALLVLLAAQTASAQSGYPDRGENPGWFHTRHGARSCGTHSADRFSEVWGTPFVVENIPGAGSNIATDRVAKAAADGYLLLMGGNSSLVINPSLYENPAIRPRSGFRAYLAGIHSPANVLAVPPDSRSRPWRNCGARQSSPGKLSYGHAGVRHVAASRRRTVQNTWRIRCCSRALSRHHALMPDLLANRISMSFANIVNVLPLAREGKLRRTGITSISVGAGADLPTMAESGFPGFEAVPWFGPAGAGRYAKGCSG